MRHSRIINIMEELDPNRQWKFVHSGDIVTKSHTTDRLRRRLLCVLQVADRSFYIFNWQIVLDIAHNRQNQCVTRDPSWSPRMQTLVRRSY